MFVWLRDILSVISGGTHIIIYADFVEVFNGKMCNVSKNEWENKMYTYMNREVIRVNTVDGAITICV